MRRSVRVSPPFVACSSTDWSSGVEKAQVEDDEADLEKLQELLVRGTFCFKLGSPQIFLGKNDGRGCGTQATGGGAAKGQGCQRGR